jgi:hypothetical protein
MKAYVSPNGDAIVAALVLTPGKCGISGINDDGSPEFDYSGTEHFYDDSYAKTRGGKQLFLCEGGSEWTFDQLVVAADEEEEDEDA